MAIMAPHKSAARRALLVSIRVPLFLSILTAVASMLMLMISGTKITGPDGTFGPEHPGDEVLFMADYAMVSVCSRWWNSTPHWISLMDAPVQWICGLPTHRQRDKSGLSSQCELVS